MILVGSCKASGMFHEWIHDEIGILMTFSLTLGAQANNSQTISPYGFDAVDERKMLSCNHSQIAANASHLRPGPNVLAIVILE